MEAVQKFDAKVISAKAILLDIEGTTTSKSFVKDTLFPYAAENVSSFLTSNWEIEEVKNAVSALRELASKDKTDAVEGCVEILEETENNRDSVIKSVVDNVKWQISLDRKTGPLKTLQGLIWEKGYKDGTIKGHVYDDVPETLASWVRSGHRLYVYSSGSVAAQKLLFGHTEKGSLLDNFTGYFDTSIGGKQEVESYKTITKEIGSDRILFLTDIVKEAAAAVEAGLSAVLVERGTDSDFTDEDRQKYSVITSFADLPLSVAGGKRKSIDKSEEELPPAKVAKTDESAEAADSTESSNECAMETETKTEKETEKESVPEPTVDEVQPAAIPKVNETEKAEETNDVEAMEVDSVSSNVKESPIKAVVNEAPECDSTDMKSEVIDAGKAKDIPETTATAKEEVVKTDVEEVSESKIEETESKMEVTESKVEEVTESKVEEVTESKVEKVTESKVEEVTESKIEEVTESKMEEVTESKMEEVTESKMEEVTESKAEEVNESKVEVTESKVVEVTESKMEEVTESKAEEVTESKAEEVTESKMEEVTESKVEEVSESKKEEVCELKKEEEVIDSKVEVTESKKEEVTQSKMEDVIESKTEEVKLAEDVTAQASTESKTNATETNIQENGKTEENKIENEKTSIEENSTTNEVKASNEETKTSKSDENEVTTTDSKSADQADHTLKESNGIETNGTNGTTAEDELVEPKKAEENGVSSDIVESSTNGADSDKENDKEEDKKAEAVTNGATNGVAEETCDVKIKKIQADSSPVPTQPEESSA